MGRKRRDKDEVSEDTQADKQSNGEQASLEPEPEEAGQAPRSRRGRKLVFLLVVAGTATYLVRRNQRKAELDEGIWHEAPAPPSATPSAPPSATPPPPPSASGSSAAPTDPTPTV